MSSLAERYDQVAYPTWAAYETHPDRLCVIGRLFGLKTPEVETCRVIELGCGDGGNLIPMAHHLPEASFLGIDLSAAAISRGEKLISDLGLVNIELRHGDLLRGEKDLGAADYIVCHDLYSFVAEPVREKVLAIIRESLAPHGVALVSYDTFPGWHTLRVSQHLMQWAARGQRSPAAQVAAARDWVDFLADSLRDIRPAYAEVLASGSIAGEDLPDAHLFHALLGPTHTPLYFRDFLIAAKKHDLQFLGNADFGTMLPDSLPDIIADRLATMELDIVAAQQLADFVRNSRRRRTLLCHHHHDLERALTLRDLEPLLVASAAPHQEGIDLAPGRPVELEGRAKVKVTCRDALAKAALWELHRCFPGELPFGELLARAYRRLDIGWVDASAAEELAAALWIFYGADIIELLTRPRHFMRPDYERPQATDLVRCEVAAGAHRVTAPQHVAFLLQPHERLLLRACDGSRSVEQLAALVVEEFVAGRVKLEVPAAARTQSSALQDAVTTQVQACLESFADRCLLAS